MSGSQVQSDFRVHVGFFTHRKTLRLEREAGAAGIVALLRLWAYAAVNHPDGFLGDVDPADLAAMGGWMGDAEALLGALERAGFLDVAGPGLRTGSDSDPSRIRFGVRFHDWREHQPYIAGRDARKEASKRANEARWTRRKSLSRKGSSDADPVRIRGGGKAESPSSTPTPSGVGGGAGAAAGPGGPPPCAAPIPWTPPAPIPGIAVGPSPRAARPVPTKEAARG